MQLREGDNILLKKTVLSALAYHMGFLPLKDFWVSSHLGRSWKNSLTDNLGVHETPFVVVIDSVVVDLFVQTVSR